MSAELQVIETSVRDRHVAVRHGSPARQLFRGQLVPKDVRHLLFLAGLGHAGPLEEHDELIDPMDGLLAGGSRYPRSTVKVPISSYGIIQLAISEKHSSIEL